VCLFVLYVLLARVACWSGHMRRMPLEFKQKLSLRARTALCSSGQCKGKWCARNPGRTARSEGPSVKWDCAHNTWESEELQLQISFAMSDIHVYVYGSIPHNSQRQPRVPPYSVRFRSATFLRELLPKRVLLCLDGKYLVFGFYRAHKKNAAEESVIWSNECENTVMLCKKRQFEISCGKK